jgi:hypothetical protein
MYTFIPAFHKIVVETKVVQQARGQVEDDVTAAALPKEQVLRIWRQLMISSLEPD